MDRKELEGKIVFDNMSYDESIMGLTFDGRVIYDYWKMVGELVSKGMTEEEAVEWIEYNTLGAYCGEKTPLVVTVMSSWE